MTTQSLLALALLAALSAPAHADSLYRCTGADGRVTISQTRCALDAEPFDVRVTRPSAAQIAEAQRVAAKTTATVERLRDQRRQANALARQVEGIRTLEARRNGELAALRAQRARARNNLAGATYLASLADREVAIVNRYAGDLDAAQHTLDQLVARGR